MAKRSQIKNGKTINKVTVFGHTVGPAGFSMVLHANRHGVFAGKKPQNSQQKMSQLCRHVGSLSLSQPVQGISASAAAGASSASGASAAGLFSAAAMDLSADGGHRPPSIKASHKANRARGSAAKMAWLQAEGNLKPRDLRF